MMTKETKDNIIFAAVFALLVLWQMLLPGYVLTLDAVFVPHVGLNLGVSGFYNDSPVQIALWLINSFFAGWIVQKLMLAALFFCLAFLAVRFLPAPKKFGANYWAALFYALNPFVYERFLAGHWTLLFAYAFLPPLVHCLLEFFSEASHKKLYWITFWTLMIGVFSLHVLTMVVLVIAACFAVGLIAAAKDKIRFWRLSKFAALFGAVFLVASSYWLIPAFAGKGASHMDSFGVANQEAFKTAGANGPETAFNVLALYGFWGERETWSDYFLSPRDHAAFWSISALALFAIVGVGIGRAFKDRKKEAFFFAAVGAGAFVLSCGLGEGVFKGFNSWLFAHVGFWRGFRDTQKWSVLIALAYAYFGAWGACAVMERLKAGTTRCKIFLFIIFCIPVLYAYPMVGGFARQLKPVWYPQSWYDAKEVLDAAPVGGQVLFLPWHQYLSLYFNQNLVSANPAKGFFGSRIVAGDNMEIGGVFSQSGDQDNLTIQSIILDEDMKPDEAIKQLEQREIRYILVLNEALSQDHLKYGVLDSRQLWEIFRTDDLTLYEIKKYNK